MKEKNILRGDLFYARLNPVIGSEQGAFRPVLVVQNNIGNAHSPTIVIVPITRNLKKSPLPTHVYIPKAYGLESECLALTEQIRTIDRTRIARYIGHICENVQDEIDTALLISIGINDNRSPRGELMDLTLCMTCMGDFSNSGYIVVRKGIQEEKEKCDFCQTGMGFLYGIIGMP